MIELTQNATSQLDSYFTGKEKAPIRVFVTEGGCSGPGLALALDEATEADDVVDVSGYQFVVEKELMEQAKPIKIDLNHMGFQIQSSLVFPAGGCGCSGGCGSGGGSGGGSCGSGCGE
jgi:Fe-S cluster assembly iron-binding protein IscA